MWPRTDRGLRCGALFPLRLITQPEGQQSVTAISSHRACRWEPVERRRQIGQTATAVCCSGPCEGRCVNTMTVSEAGISLTAPCWANPALHCLPAILRTDQVKPASHGCSQVVKELLAPGPCRLCSADGMELRKLSNKCQYWMLKKLSKFFMSDLTGEKVGLVGGCHGAICSFHSLDSLAPFDLRYASCNNA